MSNESLPPLVRERVSRLMRATQSNPLNGRIPPRALGATRTIRHRRSSQIRKLLYVPASVVSHFHFGGKGTEERERVAPIMGPKYTPRYGRRSSGSGSRAVFIYCFSLCSIKCGAYRAPAPQLLLLLPRRIATVSLIYLGILFMFLHELSPPTFREGVE